MYRHSDNDSMLGAIPVLLVLVNVIILKEAFITEPRMYGLLWFTAPLLLLAVWKVRRGGRE